MKMYDAPKHDVSFIESYHVINAFYNVFVLQIIQFVRLKFDLKIILRSHNFI
ncbi:hypothetical protein PGB90_000140 [Kerria lacca]